MWEVLAGFEEGRVRAGRRSTPRNSQGSRIFLLKVFLNSKGGHVIRLHGRHLNIPYARTKIYEFSYLLRVIRLWNSLPNFLINNSNVEAFKATIKEM